ncbi:hypothetical protein TB1_003676 [Malus domestica]
MQGLEQTKQCSAKPKPEQKESVSKHPIKYRVEESSEDVIGQPKPSSAKSESCAIKQGLKQTKQSVEPKSTAKPKKSISKMIGSVEAGTVGGSYQKKQAKDRVMGEQSVDVSSVIQEIFGRNRKLPRPDDDGHDVAMVSTFDDILKEESKSAKIAREEDWLPLEQEEKQEERFRAAKKLKIKIKVSKN